MTAERVAAELGYLDPRPPAVRVFDAGVGDGTLLARVMRAMHQRYPTLPFYVVGKEVSMEGVRLVLDKMPDRFFEHPATVLVLTNLHYAHAPWLGSPSAGTAQSIDVTWHEVSLSGSTADEFERQISTLQPWLTSSWRTRCDGDSGRVTYERPAVLVVYRRDHRFALDAVVPRRGVARAGFDLVVASQPYRSRAPLSFKSNQVLAPLVRALAARGRLIGIQSYGHDPGAEILQGVWPDENPFQHDRHAVLAATREALGADASSFEFSARDDRRSVFRYGMHALPGEAGRANSSTLMAAWNAAVYVGQVDDRRLKAAMSDKAYIDAVRSVLLKHGGLWFLDECYVIARRPH